MMPDTTLQSPWQRWLPLLTVVLAALAFDHLFWDLELGLNLLLFITLITVLLLQRYTWIGLSITARMVLGGALLAGTMVYVHHSSIAMGMAMIALGIGSALAQEARLRSLFFVVAHWFVNVIMVPWGVVGRVDDLALSRGVPRTGWRWVKVGVLPLLLVLLFTQLYRAGNPKFDHLTAGFMDGLWEVFGEVLERIFTPHTFFFLLALVICAALIHRFAPQVVVQLEQHWTDALVRTRTRRPHWLAPRAMDPLERERRMGVILLVAVNALLIVVNVIDINWVWFGFTVPVGFSLKQFVHEGTWLLIVSILLSMVLLMYLFRGNQDFYSRNTWLKRLAICIANQDLSSLGGLTAERKRLRGKLPCSDLTAQSNSILLGVPWQQMMAAENEIFPPRDPSHGVRNVYATIREGSVVEWKPSLAVQSAAALFLQAMGARDER